MKSGSKKPTNSTLSHLRREALAYIDVLHDPVARKELGTLWVLSIGCGSISIGLAFLRGIIQ